MNFKLVEIATNEVRECFGIDPIKNEFLVWKEERKSFVWISVYKFKPYIAAGLS